MDPHRLFEFEGYGGERPRVFFIGLEENSGDDEENLRRRALFGRRMDLRRAHDLLVGAEWWQRGSARVPVWQVAAQIRAALALGTTEGPQFETEWRRIRSDLLGRDHPDADTLLSELLPVPTSRNRTWPDGYRELLGYDSYTAPGVPGCPGGRHGGGSNASLWRSRSAVQPAAHPVRVKGGSKSHVDGRPPR